MLSRNGAHDEAAAIIREALALLEPTDATVLLIEAQLDLGEVLAAAGDVSGARDAYTEARRLADEKGGVVILGTVIRRLESLDTAHI